MLEDFNTRLSGIVYDHINNGGLNHSEVIEALKTKIAQLEKERQNVKPRKTA